MRYAILLLLSGCASAPPIPPDASVTPEIRLVWVRTEQAWHAIVKARGQRADMEANGFYMRSNGVCYVYAPDPALETKRSYRIGQWGTLGHEVKHCFDGRFHD